VVRRPHKISLPDDKPENLIEVLDGTEVGLVAIISNPGTFEAYSRHICWHLVEALSEMINSKSSNSWSNNESNARRM